MDAAARKIECTAEEVLFVAVEMSWKKWKVGSKVGLGQKPRMKTIDAGDVKALMDEVGRAKRRFGLELSTKVVSCFEAGRDGFWLHRFLEAEGLTNVVVDPASVSVNRRKRRRKTDRLDAAKLLNHLIHWHVGQKKEWSVVAVPRVEDEDARQFHRELACLQKERTRSINRIKGLLAGQGVRFAKVGRDFLQLLHEARLWDGSKIPGQLRARLVREYERMQLVKEQIGEMERQRREAMKRVQDPRLEMIRSLQRLRGVGERSPWVLVMEFFGWRKFENGRQVGSLAGLTPTPFNSGAGDWEQGIDKAGNARVRSVMIELAWGWLRYQPKSRLSLWFEERFGAASRRSRRVGIVALARKLLIALWRYLETGVVPEGAVLKKA